MTHLLAIECSTPLLTLALFKENQFIEEIDNRGVKQTHSEFLIPLIDQFLKKHKLKIKDMGQFAISNGPGGFTSIRVGLSSLVGLVAPEPKPVALVSTLQVQANHYFQNYEKEDLVFSTLRAGRGRIYMGGYQRDQNTNLALPQSELLDQTLTKDRAHQIIQNNSYIIIGEGQSILDQDIRKIPNISPTAKSVGQIAIQNNIWIEDPTQIQPAYLQEPDIG